MRGCSPAAAPSATASSTGSTTKRATRSRARGSGRRSSSTPSPPPPSASSAAAAAAAPTLAPTGCATAFELAAKPLNTNELPLCRRLRGAEGVPSWQRVRAPPPADGGEALMRGWLEEVQAALDTTYWMLHRGHLKVEALLSPTGALRAAGAALPALFAAVHRGVDHAGGAARVRTASTDALHAAARDALKAGFRLLNDLLNGPAKADGRLDALLAAHADAPAATARQCALLAALRPTRLGFEPSEVEECKRMRSVAVALLGALHRRAPAALEEEVRALHAADAAADPAALQPGAAGADAMEQNALLEGHIALLKSGEGGAKILRGAIGDAAGSPRRKSRAAPRWARVGRAAGAASARANGARQGTRARVRPRPHRHRARESRARRRARHRRRRRRRWRRRDGWRRGGGGGRRAGGRGARLVELFEAEVVAQIAESSELADVGRRLLLGTFANNDAQRARLSALLLAVLRLLVSRRELASEKLVETLDNALPQLLLQAPLTENGLDGRLELFQLLLELGGHVVLRPTGHDVAAPATPSTPLSSCSSRRKSGGGSLTRGGARRWAHSSCSPPSCCGCGRRRRAHAGGAPCAER